MFNTFLPSNNYIVKVNNKNTRGRRGKLFKLTMKLLYGVFLANIEQIWHQALMFLYLPLKR